MKNWVLQSIKLSPLQAKATQRERNGSKESAECEQIQGEKLLENTQYGTVFGFAHLIIEQNQREKPVVEYLSVTLFEMTDQI